jgi:flagellar biogenesis protein FliO
MANQRKKIGLLCLLLVVSGGWIALASRQGGDIGQQKPDSRIDSSSFLSDPNLPSAPGVHLGNGELFLRMMLSVGLVIGLGGVALYLSKRALPRMVHSAGKEIHVLETTYLGPRKALHLVEVGSQRLLIASTHDRITMLVPVSDAWLDVPQPELGEAIKA